MYIIVLSIIAGIIGIGAGGLLTVSVGSRTERITNIFIVFAGGVMTSIVFFELLPEARANSDVPTTIIGFVCGILLVFGIESFSHHKLRSGMLMFFVISLHNIPEGFALGATGIYDVSLGFTLAVMISIHNIPVGMAIAAPLLSDGLSKWKTVLITLSAGASTVLGACAGVFIGDISEITLAFSLALAGGAMLYVVLSEILPLSIRMSNGRFPMIVAIAGIAAGLLITGV